MDEEDKKFLIRIKGKCLPVGGDNIKTNDLETIIFTAIGLLLIGISLPKLISGLLSIFMMWGQSNLVFSILPGLAGTLTQLGIGIGLFLGSPLLVSLLEKIRSII